MNNEEFLVGSTIKKFKIEPDYYSYCYAGVDIFEKNEEQKAYKIAVHTYSSDNKNNSLDLFVSSGKLSEDLKQKIKIHYEKNIDDPLQILPDGDVKFDKEAVIASKYEIEELLSSGFDDELNKLLKYAYRFICTNTVMRNNNILWDKTKELQNICDGHCFNEKQKAIIRYGLVNGLSADEIKKYAKEYYNSDQMIQLVFGIIDKLDSVKLNLYSDSDLNAEQMEEIRIGLSNGLSVEDVEIYADKKFDNLQMLEIRKGLSEGLDHEQIAIFAKPELSCTQMAQIRFGLEAGVEKDKILQIAKASISDTLMGQCIYQFKEEKLKDDFKNYEMQPIYLLNKMQDGNFSTIDISELSESAQFEIWKILKRNSDKITSLSGNFEQCLNEISSEIVGFRDRTNRNITTVKS